MQRVNTLLQKLTELAEKGDKAALIEIDLMLDYTRVLYADLVERRNRAVFYGTIPDAEPETKQTIQTQPSNNATNHTPPPTPVAEKQPEPISEEPKPVPAPPEPETEEEQDFEEEPKEAPTPAPERPNPDAIPAPAVRLDYSSKIQKMIGINDKYLFISELFRNDLEAYEFVLNKVNEMDNYKETEEWIKDNPHNRYDWDGEDATVETFYGAVKTFFASR